ncbi:MAG TPA: integrase arm-type DNA-binding domain-containing protein [Gammaproteobacteria bacterium]|nr:integrase arm-type DNA-binding domain-containing protein [Gammaproteobacteria bacterium]
MPRKAREMSAVEVRRLPEGLHAVGGVDGLLMRVKPTGARSWVLRVVIGSKRRDVGLGGFPDIPLQTARERAREAREQIRAGTDPVATRKAARAALVASQAVSITFEQAARECHASKSKEFRNPKHAAQWLSTIETYANPVIGKLPIDQVDLSHVVKILEPIWETKTETATRLRQRMEQVIAWATVRGKRTGENPARWKGHLDAVLPKPGKVSKVEHHRALPVPGMYAFMNALRERAGMAARCLEFAILTAARSGEARGATWDEIDIEAKLWTVPGARMKAGKDHRVPLSADAVALLEALPRMQDSSYVFTAPRGGKLSDMALLAVMQRMEVDAVPHGFRSTFRDWCAEHTNYPREVAEMALAHTISNDVERAYRRGDLFEKRRKLMAEWARFIRKPPAAAGDVVPMRARA